MSHHAHDVRHALAGDLHAFVQRALSAPFAPGERRVIACPAPVAPPETLLQIAPRLPAILWAPPGSVAWAGLGAALVVEGAGPARFEALAAALPAAARSIRLLAHPDATGFEPSFFGGIAFEPGTSGAWAAFGDASLVLPRWTYRVDGAHAVLAIAVAREDGAAAVLEELASLLDLLAHPAPPRTGVPRAHHVADAMAPEAWAALVGAAQAEIARGAFEKVVLARCTRLAADPPYDAATALRRLAEQHRDAYRFAFRRGGATFLGATPEPLVVKRGREVEAEALAGTAARPADPSREREHDLAASLVHSIKDNDEHRPVVVAIREALEPFCAELTVGRAPEVRVLPELLHLSTPIRGRLADDTPLTTLVRALHPTPAMGGYPKAPALAFIAAHEPAPRGWYAGPVGRIGQGGDGEFAVAIRCALLAGAEALVFAGAGIIAGSDARTEFAETAAKERTILAALDRA